MSDRVKNRATFTRGRRFAIGLNVLIASLLAPAVGALLIYLGFRPEIRHRIDLTSRQTFSLAERTLKVLEALKDPVDVYTCFRPSPTNEAGRYSPGLEVVQGIIATHANDLVREFEVRAHGKLKAHLYDLNSFGHMERISELSHLIDEPALNVVVVVCGKRHRVLKLGDLADFDPGTQTREAFTRPQLFGFRDEESLTRTILSVTEERAQRVGFLTGHDERDPQTRGTGKSGTMGMSFLALGLVSQNYSIIPVELVEGHPLTKDGLDVLVIAEPSKPLTAPEVDAIVHYAKDGGKVLALLGLPSANSLDFPLLDQVYGLSRTPNPVCQETRFGDLKFEGNVLETGIGSSPAEGDYSPDQPIVKPLRSKQLRTYWRDVCALKALGRQDQSDVKQSPLAWSSAEGWIDLPDANKKYNHLFDPGSEQKQGPYVLAYAIELKSGGRAVVFGCTTTLDDEGWNKATGNADFGLNVVDWLAEREQMISIAPKPYDVVQVDLTPAEFRSIFIYVVLGVPALALLLGVAVFWARRN